MSDLYKADDVIDGLFRGYSSKAIASLTRIFGAQHMELAEEVVQESLLKAVLTWRVNGTPPNPEAWLYRTAKNLAIDALRRLQNFDSKKEDIAHHLESSFVPQYELADEGYIHDDELKMLFMCCHPLLPYEMQLCLTLKVAAGLSVDEISRAFLSNPETIAQRIVRAKRKIRENDLRFELPSVAELPKRTDAVLNVIYLLFNEGYGAHEGERLVREDLCAEAIRLMSLLVKHKTGNVPKAHALMSLLLLQASRLEARLDEEGIVLLQDQDRSLWDMQMVQLGMHHLKLSGTGNELSTYHLQAGIAAIHCLSDSYEATDWSKILWYYDELMRLYPSPVFALNRAVAVSYVTGAADALDILYTLREEPKLNNYYLFFATLAEMQLRCGYRDLATESYIEALSLVRTAPERKLLLRKLDDCGTGS